MRHADAWRRLPDLLEDRDEPGLLAHVRVCADCQRQLFLLGRVDRLLRDEAAFDRPRQRWPSLRRGLAAVAALAAAAIILVALLLPHNSRGKMSVLRTATGRPVAQAVMSHGDARNASLALTAHHLPISGGHMFVLWASDDQSSMQVGRFMVDQTGGCNVRFNLPASHPWKHFWVTPQGNATDVVAST